MLYIYSCTSIMLDYKETITTKISKSKALILQQLGQLSSNIKIKDNVVDIKKHNSFTHLLAPTGEIRIELDNPDNSDETTLNCLIKPSIFTFRSAFGFTTLSIILWALIFWFFPINMMMVVAFVLHWIVMCFVALYLLVTLMGVITIMLLIYNFYDFPFIYIVVAWVVTFLITNLTLQYNKKTLKIHSMSLINQLKTD